MAKGSVPANVQQNVISADKSLNAKTGKAPSWNFTKILISKNGKETHVFSSNVEPDDLSILSKIEKLL